MGTTINLPDEPIRRAKKAALEANTTLTKIAANDLREAVAKPHPKKERSKFKLITYGRGGLQAGVNLVDTSALLDIMDGLVDPTRR